MSTLVTCTYGLILPQWQYQDQLHELVWCTPTNMPTWFTNMVEQTEVLDALLLTTEMHALIAKIVHHTTLVKTLFRDYVPPVALLISNANWDQLTRYPLKMRCCRWVPKIHASTGFCSFPKIDWFSEEIIV